MPVNKRKVCVIGCGLMGGSLIRSLQGKDYLIWAVDTDSVVLNAVHRENLVWRCSSQPKDALDWADLVVFCTMPHTTLRLMELHSVDFSPQSVVTDFCGVKKMLMDVAEKELFPRGVRYVGAHPMAGREQGSFFNATPNLYRGANALICPHHGSHPEDVESVESLLKDAGCHLITICDAEKHDRMIAFTSQMMHIIAASIANHPNFPDSSPYEGGSLRDFTRIATLDSQMWGDLFLLNREALLPNLKDYVSQLNLFIHALETMDESGLKEELVHSNKAKEKW